MYWNVSEVKGAFDVTQRCLKECWMPGFKVLLLFVIFVSLCKILRSTWTLRGAEV